MTVNYGHCFKSKTIKHTTKLAGNGTKDDDGHWALHLVFLLTLLKSRTSGVHYHNIYSLKTLWEKANVSLPMIPIY